ncbi:PREDICTED: LOW QUALITY PROTEIN: uncharacterized protein C15orf32 homolog [Ceratotherium simum simum]|uniref:LOW QUALITY PROTEIN: uncharacterized protein C15orf32 homolog n=1 Tax=Ceratotherium simum simum TaxID=73337 RepID=A0ABM1CX73_CERSS|nr:PREDICTED: LOW QUALITY PROTEIN: uncharacterized protein C15orf32 homolog [Ceratotherium simum simum]
MGSSSPPQVGIRTPENFMTPALYGKLISDPTLQVLLHPFHRLGNQGSQRLKTRSRCQGSMVNGLMPKPTRLAPAHLLAPQGHLILSTLCHVILFSILDPEHMFCVAHVSTDCKLNRGSVERHKKGKHLRTVSAGW